jgi:prephenate dehydrogenase
VKEPPFAGLRCSRLERARVAIVGLGLMGGSLAAALKARHACSRVVGVARRQETADRALARRYVDEANTDLAAGVAEADIVVLAMPVRAIIQTLPDLGRELAPGALLVDLGSTKARIAAAMATLPAHVHVCPAHPMCGKELAGLDAADPDLFADRTFVVSPLERTRPEALALCEELVGAVGARPLRLDPARHDRLVAVASHLPYLLALALVAVAGQVASEDPLLWQLAASGFRDTSRLAASDVTMMLDVLMTNPGAIAGAVAQCREQLGRFEQLLHAGDEEGLRQMMEGAAARRRAWAEPHVGAAPATNTHGHR